MTTTNGAIPASVADQLEQWATARGLTVDDLRGVGCEVQHHPRFGHVLRWPYRFADGRPAGRLLALELPRGRPEWRNDGEVKGAVMVLGDAQRAETVVIAEGESDGLALHKRHGGDDLAVLVLPGASIVGEDLANFVGTPAKVVIATDADGAGDRCAATVASVLDGAGVAVSLLRRLRPLVPGIEAPDLRDLLAHLDAGTDPEGVFGRLLVAAPPVVPVADERRVDLPQESHEPAPSTWCVSSLIEAARSGQSEAPPSILRTADGEGALLYAGKRGILAGESDVGKTWIAGVAVAEVVRDFGDVLWIDFDGMGAKALSDRLLAVGLTEVEIERHVDYLAPDCPPSDADRELIAHYAAGRPALVVVDSFDPGLTALGLEINATGDIDRFCALLVDPFHKAGSSTLLLDHVVKDPDARRGFSGGSQRKRGAVDYLITVTAVGSPFTRTSPGTVRLAMPKDRPGHHERLGSGRLVGSIAFTPDGQGGLGWDLTLGSSASGAPSGDSDWRPTLIMERVSRCLEEANDALSTKAIEDRVKGKRDYVRQALEHLVAGSFVATEDGPRGARLHRSIGVYRQPVEGDESTSPRPRPDLAPGEDDDLAPVPPLYFVKEAGGEVVNGSADRPARPGSGGEVVSLSEDDEERYERLASEGPGSA